MDTTVVAASEQDGITALRLGFGPAVNLNVCPLVQANLASVVGIGTQHPAIVD